MIGPDQITVPVRIGTILVRDLGLRLFGPVGGLKLVGPVRYLNPRFWSEIKWPSP